MKREKIVYLLLLIMPIVDLITSLTSRFYPEFILNIQAYFEEIGTTGIRDTIGYELCRRQNLVGGGDDPLKGWAKDPYDETINFGALMNLSETEQFDKQFPGFPLTMCREFLRAIQ